MESVTEILNNIFGGQITVDKITTILVAIFALIKSITEWKAKKRLIVADKEISSADQKFKAQQEELDNLKKSNAMLANIIVTAYLSSNTLDDTAKKKIASYATKADEIAGIEFSELASNLIKTVNNHIPGLSLNEKKEQIINEVKATEEVLDSAIEGAVSAIDALNL